MRDNNETNKARVPTDRLGCVFRIPLESSILLVVITAFFFDPNLFAATELIDQCTLARSSAANDNETVREKHIQKMKADDNADLTVCSSDPCD